MHVIQCLKYFIHENFEIANTDILSKFLEVYEVNILKY